MKEYLFKNCFGEYKQVNPELVAKVLPLKHWVEIPEGAESFNYYEDEGNVYFFKWLGCEPMFANEASRWSWNNWGDISFDNAHVLWEREANKLLTKTPFTYDRLLGCYVEHYASCSNSGYIVSVRHNTIGEPVFEVEGSEWDYGILAKEVIFYTEDTQPLSFEQYKEMYYTEDTSNEVVK